MGWPPWIDAIRDRYLADEGNVFLLTGAVGEAWPMGDEPLGAVELLARMLSPTRPIVGVLRPGEPIVFPNLGDELRFERTLSAREVVTGQRLRRRAVDLGQRLDLIHASLQSPGLDQAWIFVEADRLFPPRRSLAGHVAPALPDWAESLRRTNHLLVLLAPSAEAVSPELARVAVHVHIEPPPTEPEAHSVAETPVELPAAPLHEPTDDPALPSADELAEELEAAIQLTLPAHPMSTWDSRLPVIEAAAIVVQTHAPSMAPLALALDDEGRVKALTPQTELFLSRWQNDVALDAAAGMLLREIVHRDESGEGPVELHPTALRALARRLLRMLAS